MLDEPSTEQQATVGEQLRQISTLAWLLSLFGAVLAGLLSWGAVGIASDARSGHDLAVQIEREQRTLSATLTEVRNEMMLQRQANYTLREQILLLDQSSKMINQTIDRQHKIIEAIGDLTYRVKVLENSVENLQRERDRMFQHTP